MNDTTWSPDWPDKTHPEMMTVEDVARRLNVLENFVYQAIAEGRLKHHRLGKAQGAIRVSETQLADFLRRTEQGDDAPKESTPVPKPNALRRTFSFLPPPS